MFSPIQSGYDDDSIYKLKTWLLVKLGVETIKFTKHVILQYLFLARNLQKREYFKLNKIFNISLWTLYIPWLVYGNFIVYSPNVLSSKDNDQTVYSLWCLAMIAIILGYFVIIIYLFFVFLIIASCCVSCIFGRREGRKIFKIMIFFSPLSGLKQLSYEDVEDKIMNKCTICLERY